MSVKKKKKKSAISKSLEHSVKHKNDGMGGFILKLPDGIKFIKLEKDKKYRLSFIAYKISSENHPLFFSSDEFEKGDYVYNLILDVHRGLGPDKKRAVICLTQFKRDCPCCNKIIAAEKEGRMDIATALKTTKRVFYLVVDMKNVDAGLWVLESSHHTFDKPLTNAAQGSSGEEDDDEIEDGILEFPIISDEYTPDEFKGYAVKFMMVQDIANGYKYLKPGNFEFHENKMAIPSKIFKDVFSLDDCMNILDEKEMKILVSVGGMDENNSDDSDDLDDSDDEEPKEKKKGNSKKSKTNKCPAGHVFGKDFEKDTDDCDDCDMWTDCKLAEDEEDD